VVVVTSKAVGDDHEAEATKNIQVVREERVFFPVFYVPFPAETVSFRAEEEMCDCWAVLEHRGLRKLS